MKIFREPDTRLSSKNGNFKVSDFGVEITKENIVQVINLWVEISQHGQRIEIAKKMDKLVWEFVIEVNKQTDDQHKSNTYSNMRINVG